MGSTTYDVAVEMEMVIPVTEDSPDRALAAVRRLFEKRWPEMALDGLGTIRRMEIRRPADAAEG